MWALVAGVVGWRGRERLGVAVGLWPSLRMSCDGLRTSPPNCIRLNNKLAQQVAECTVGFHYHEFFDKVQASVTLPAPPNKGEFRLPLFKGGVLLCIYVVVGQRRSEKNKPKACEQVARVDAW